MYFTAICSSVMKPKVAMTLGDDFDEGFEAVLAPRHNVNDVYALWQVSLQKYPHHDVHRLARLQQRDNTSLETNLQNHRPGCTILATEIDPSTELRHGDWFTNYDTMQQTNSMTGTVRLVRRVMVTSPRTELPQKRLGTQTVSQAWRCRILRTTNHELNKKFPLDKKFPRDMMYMVDMQYLEVTLMYLFLQMKVWVL